MLFKYMYLEIPEVVDTEEKWEGVIFAPCVSFNVRGEISRFGLGMSHCSICHIRTSIQYFYIWIILLRDRKSVV